MNSTSVARRAGVPLILVVLVAASALLLGDGAARARGAGPRTVPVAGQITYVGAPAGCDSPVGICTTGRYSGVLQATARTSVQQVIPSSPDGMFFIRESEVITLPGGTLTTSINAAAHFVAGGQAASIHTITGGTGDYAGATGSFSFVAVVDETGGGASGTYRGELQIP